VIKEIKSLVKCLLLEIVKVTPFLSMVYYTRKTSTPITLKILFFQKVLGFNKKAYWPVHFTSTVYGEKNIVIGIETCPGYMQNCYIQGGGGVEIGDYTQIGPSVGIISANHDLYNNKKRIKKNVKIGKYCWIGMGSVILPGVKLGDFTVVGAGSIVSKSFCEGYCVVAGNPAKIIKYLEREKCKEFSSEFEYNGYIQHKDFEKFRSESLNL